jgi:hypothetical protein
MAMLIPGRLDYEPEIFWILAPPFVPLLSLSLVSLFLAKLKSAFLIHEIPAIRDETGIIHAFSNFPSCFLNILFSVFGG